MKIVFWNIGYVPGLNGSLVQYALLGHRLLWSLVSLQKKLLNGIAALIQKENPDLFLYAEISIGTLRTQGFNQHAYLVEQVDGVKSHGAIEKYRSAIFHRLPLHRGNANGFLSPHECIVSTHHLKAGQKTLVYKIEQKGITVLMVHLSLAFTTRQRQLKELAEIVQGIEGPCVLCGDMNIFRGLEELGDLIKLTGLQLPLELPKTFPSFKPTRTLDVFLTKNIDGKVSVRSLDSMISDHKPIVLEFST